MIAIMNKQIIKSSIRKGIFIFSITITFIIIMYSGCKRDEPIIDLKTSNYPTVIGNIILTKCAVSGCHNTQSKNAAAGLDLTSWSTMMDGDRNGAVCIPYSAENSTLFYLPIPIPNLDQWFIQRCLSMTTHLQRSNAQHS